MSKPRDHQRSTPCPWTTWADIGPKNATVDHIRVERIRTSGPVPAFDPAESLQVFAAVRGSVVWRAHQRTPNDLDWSLWRVL